MQVCSQTFQESIIDMPWDEMDEPTMTSAAVPVVPQQQQNVQNVQNVPASTVSEKEIREEVPAIMPLDLESVSVEWRRIGLARRKSLLEADRRKGGTHFDINPNCSVGRYFNVAHRTWQLFSKMYQLGANLEDTYVMGYRMLSFLTECLPRHPAFLRPAAADSRKRCQSELKQLQTCLEDLALRIDEEQCNQFADDFDPFVHDSDDSDSECEEVSKTNDADWVGFSSWKQDRKPLSPTTIATTGTDSLDELDLSSSDEGTPERQIDFSLYEEENVSVPILPPDFRTEFLDRVAQEDVEFETDSDADDSWAQGPEEVENAPSASSGQGDTCDPARIAFRELLNRAPKDSALSLGKGSPLREKLRRPDPPAQMPHVEPVVPRIDPEGQRCEPVGYSLRESQIETDIQSYLESPEDVDPSVVLESSLEKMRNQIPQRKSDAKATSELTAFETSGLDSNGWVAFDS
eukprot:Nitzschia sp. Nitz4//scaffold11_size288233//163710//165156//NITZ4_000782-RA/size288233-snap-gene-0.50-mRNA-1//-1//CDS//3329534098//1329//frame0